MRTHLVLLCAALLAGCGASGSDSKDDTNGGAGGPAASGKNETATSKTGQAITIVHGTFAEASLGLDNARVIAIADDQSSYWAYLDANGEFSLELPVGFSYRIVFANQLDGGGQVKIGSVAFKTSAGYSAWFGANISGSVDLGMVTTNESGAGSSSGGSHADNSGCQKDDGSAKKDPTSGAGVNVCLIWPTVILFPGVAIDAKFADKGTHPTSNHDDDQTCGYWNVEGGIVWAAPSIGLGAGFGPIQAGADIGISASSGSTGGFDFGGGFGMSSSWSYSSSADYSFGANGNYGSNSSYHFSTSSSWSYSASGSYGGGVNAGGSYAYSSAVNYSWHSSMGYAGTVAIAGGVTLGVAYGVESDYQVGGVIAAANVSGGWAVGMSSEYHAEVAGGVCVSASTCDNGLSCTAGTCIKQ